MSTATLTLALPDTLYKRLERAATATNRSVQDVALHAIHLGSPPMCDDAPPEFQADLEALEGLDDEALRKIASSRMTGDAARRDKLLATSSEGGLPPAERLELQRLRHEEDLFMFRKAHAATLLQWRGHPVPSL